MHSVFKLISYPHLKTGDFQISLMWRKDQYGGTISHFSNFTPFKSYQHFFQICVAENDKKGPKSVPACVQASVIACLLFYSVKEFDIVDLIMRERV